jgi:hypothetical protein
MKLSDKLRQWRADRPDEWKMDEFIRMAEELERDAYTHTFNDTGVRKDCTVIISKPDSDGRIVVEDRFGDYHVISNRDVYLKN